MPNVVLAGHVCIDRNQSEHATYTGWGSSVVYMADHLQRHWQVQPTILTRYGKDFLPYASDFLLHPSTAQETSTMMYENITKGHLRRQLCHHHHVADAPAIDSGAEALLRTADILVIAPLLPNYHYDFVRQLTSLVPPACLKVLTPQGYLRQIDSAHQVQHRQFIEARDIVPLFDVVIFSEHDYPEALTVAAQWHAWGTAHIVVTMGADGATIVSADGSHLIPTTPIAPEHIVDSVGCGDVFAAAMVMYLQQGCHIGRAVQNAHKVAGRKLFTVPQENQSKTKTIH